MFTITLVAFKGGVGKTTSAIHIASYLSQFGPTLLVDGDPNRSASTWAKPNNLPFTVLNEIAALHQKGEFKYQVIDTKARPEKEDLELFVKNCDYLVVPTEPDTLSLATVVRVAKTFEALKADRYKVLITKVPPKPSRAGQDAQEFLTASGIPQFERYIRRFEAFRKAVDLGVPVSKVRDEHAIDGWNDYLAICKELGL
jgi:chromosome partitioning protein